ITATGAGVGTGAGTATGAGVGTGAGAGVVASGSATWVVATRALTDTDSVESRFASVARSGHETCAPTALMIGKSPLSAARWVRAVRSPARAPGVVRMITEGGVTHPRAAVCRSAVSSLPHACLVQAFGARAKAAGGIGALAAVAAGDA